MIKYPKVLQLQHLEGKDIKVDGVFYLEEKYDGSQFRFGQDKSGKRWFGSRSVTYSDERPPNTMFALAVQQANEAMDRIKTLLDGNTETYFYAEYIAKPKHNTLTYARTPRNNLVLFDVISDGSYQLPEVVNQYAELMQLEPVYVFTSMDKYPQYKSIEFYLNSHSSLQGTTVEGVVIKNYHIHIADMNGELRPLFSKYVRPSFKEMNNKEWKTKPGKRPVIDEVMDIFNKDAIFQKAVQHLNESGEAEHHMRDMQKLIPLVYQDLYEEYMPAIQELIVKRYEHDIQRAIISGLPEFYKKYLYSQMESTINGDKQ